MLLVQGHKIEAMGMGGVGDAQAHIGLPCRDASRYGGVGVFFMPIALESRGLQAPFLQGLVQQQAGPRTGAAVDKAHARLAKIGPILQAQGVPLGDHQPLPLLDRLDVVGRLHQRLVQSPARAPPFRQDLLRRQRSQYAAYLAMFEGED